jgi:transposase-like protein
LSTDRRFRRFRSISEKLQIVQLTLKPGASVAQVAQAHGVNAKTGVQVASWIDRGELSEPSVVLVPVMVGI